MTFKRRMAGIAVAVFMCLPARPGLALDDPLESFNRSVFEFNRTVIEQMINPTVDALRPWLPELVLTGLGNAYANLTEMESIFNTMLTGDFAGLTVAAARLGINSTLGLAGLMDVATPMGLERTTPELGESLCRAGVEPGPYLVLPLVGPANVVSATMISTAFFMEFYLLGIVSSALASAEVLFNVGAPAVTLRHATEIPPADEPDPYDVQRARYASYLEKGCVVPPDEEPETQAQD
jgi:phospholipid-binding lipoprotein MlaA